jgi:GH35 family endo-1,4-beta-xylanase
MTAVLASCVDDTPLTFAVKEPASIAEMKYLNDYETLRTYIDRSANPIFKLGSGVSVGDYNAGGVIYRLVNSNFDEIVAGWDMKHGAVVQADGSLSLGNVGTFLTNAANAGISVYGHTLVWHANQNAEYLNGLIADVFVPGGGGPSYETICSQNFETDDASNYSFSVNGEHSFTAVGEGKDATGRALKIINGEVRANDWECQLFVTFSHAVTEGEKITLTMDIKSDIAASYSTQAHTAPGAYKHWDFFGALSSTPEWTTFEKEITVSADQATCTTIAFNLGNTATAYYFDNITVQREKAAGEPVWNTVTENNFETDNASNYSFNASAIHAFTATGAGAGGRGRALTVTNTEVRANDWECQLFVTFPEAVAAGDKIKLSMDIKSDVPASYSTQAHTAPGAYKHWDFFGALGSTPEWTTFEKEITVSTDQDACTTIAFNLGNTATTYYFDNLKVTKLDPYGGGTYIVKTDEEKMQIIGEAMETWISGMVGACKETVHAWDIVNEPMSDWPDPSLLKTGVGKTDMSADEFYWQDYLGKDYAVKAIQFARQYGNSDDKLFINDYGVESSLDKCRGLIEYVKYVESKGVKVDGIGTQMHVTCNEADMNTIVESFKLLAATGKLIKISELDMGYRAPGASANLKTEELTEAQHKEMSALYNEIIKAYFANIPVGQRYGITQWSPTDSPGGSSWRAGEPIGLWSLNYNRKHAYAGFADGLAGK